MGRRAKKGGMDGGGNPYQLDDGRRREGPDRTVRAAVLTDEEKRQKLQGYVKVPREFWPFLKYSTHVRYIETAAKGGEFRSGGFVLKNPFDTKVRGGLEEKRFVKLQNGFYKAARDHAEWIVAYEDIEHLYAKGEAVELTLQRDIQTAVAALSSNISRVAEYCKKLEQRVAACERQ